MMDATARFTDTVTIVTGASRGIGFAIAQRLIAEGGRVVGRWAIAARDRMLTV